MFITRVIQHWGLGGICLDSSHPQHVFFTEDFRPDTCRFGLDQYPEIDVAKHSKKTLARVQLEGSKSLKKRDFLIKILEGICYLLNVTFQKLQKKPLCLGYLLNVTFQILQKRRFTLKSDKALNPWKTSFFNSNVESYRYLLQTQLFILIAVPIKVAIPSRKCNVMDPSSSLARGQQKS